MPEFAIVPVHEAQLRTIRGRQGKFINEYADYIQQLHQGQAGKLRIGEMKSMPLSDAGLIQLRMLSVLPW
jgi:hypothetical protein